MKNNMFKICSHISCIYELILHGKRGGNYKKGGTLKVLKMFKNIGIHPQALIRHSKLIINHENQTNALKMRNSKKTRKLFGDLFGSICLLLYVPHLFIRCSWVLRRVESGDHMEAA